MPSHLVRRVGRGQGAHLPRLVPLLAANLLSIAAIAPPALATAADPPNVSHGARGRYLYKTVKEGLRRGEESWTLSVHPDGSRTMRMLVRIDETGVLRDVVLRVDPRYRPLETYMSLWVKGQWMGSGLFSVSGTTLDAVVNGPTGRLTQLVAVPDGFSMVSHPVAADGWHFWYYDEAAGGVQPGTVYNPETLGGGTGAILGRVQKLPLRLVGDEQVETPAGRFLTRHWEMASAFHVWVAETNRMMVRMTLESADREYVLVEHEEME